MLYHNSVALGHIIQKYYVISCSCHLKCVTVFDVVTYARTSTSVYVPYLPCLPRRKVGKKEKRMTETPSHLPQRLLLQYNEMKCNGVR